MILAIDSNYEEIVSACLQYRQDNVFPNWENSRTPVTKLVDATATRSEVANHLADPTIRYVTGSGHGFVNLFTGTNESPVLKVGEYGPSEVAGRIIHLLSCSTAQELGPDLVAKGCKAFFGYDVEFLFPVEQPALFLDCDAQIDIALVSGGAARAAYEAAADLFRDRIQQLLDTQQAELAALLEFNLEHLCAPSTDSRYGSEDAVL